MKYLKKFNEEKVEEILLNNVNIHHTLIKEMCEIKLPDPEHGNLRLNVFPFENTGKYVSLPEGFKMWEKSFNEIISKIPLQEEANTHYVTINSEFFTTDDFLRREGVHMDGNFCVDPLFSSISEKKSWGGVSPKETWGGVSPKESWGGVSFNDDEGGEESDEEKERRERIAIQKKRNNKIDGLVDDKDEDVFYESIQYLVKENNSHVKMDWVLPYNITIPIAQYVSEKKGGILTVSTEVGCQGWSGTFKGEVLSEGSYEAMSEQLTDDKKIIFEKNKLYFMSSNTPHETLKVGKGKRRTFLRITLNHNYLNEDILK